MRVEFSSVAKADLLEIAIYIAQDNPKRARSFVDELEAKCKALGGAPGIGTARPEIGEGLRAMTHGHYLIFYRALEQHVRIERVMHGARDIGGNNFDAADLGDQS